MKKYKYNGNTVSLGRHGLVAKGQVISLTEAEAYALEHSSEKSFINVREQVPEGFPSELGLPTSGAHFDLTTLHWKSPVIFKDVRKMRRAKLMAVILQLEASGFPVPCVNSRTDQEVMRDIVLTTGRLANWI